MILEPMEQPDDCAIVLTHMEVLDYLTEEGKRIVVFRAEDHEGALPELVNMLGALEMCKDTAFRMARGEWPEDEDEDEEADHA